MKRSKLKNLFKKLTPRKLVQNIKFNETTVSIYYVKQKKQYYKNLDIQLQTIKNSGKTSNLTLAKVTQIQKKTMLLENNLIKTNEKEIATIMNKYFTDITKNLDLKASKKCNTKDLNSNVSEFNYYVSIKKIKEFFPDINVNDFDFDTVTMEAFKKKIVDLNIKKSSTPVTILNNFKIVLTYLFSVFNKVCKLYY